MSPILTNNNSSWETKSRVLRSYVWSTLLYGSERSLLFKYAPIITNEGLVRIAGRILKAEIPFDVRHPIVLPKCSPIVQLIVRDAHQKVGHFGKDATVAKTRERYWIYGVSQLANKVARANDTYCLQLDEATKKQHPEAWSQEKEIWVANVKTCAEDWFVGRAEEESVASKRSTSASGKSAARLAEESRKIKKLKKMEILLIKEQELERRVKFMGIELQQEERSQIREKIVKSQSRSQVIQEMEDEEAESQSLDEEVAYNERLDKQGEDNEDSSLCGVDAVNITRKEPILKNLVKFFWNFKTRNWKLKSLMEIACLSPNS
eukprot:gene12404-3063_t